MGDGILSVFPIAAPADRTERCSQATASVAGHTPDLYAPRGHHDVRGLTAPVELFGLLEPGP